MKKEIQRVEVLVVEMETEEEVMKMIWLQLVLLTVESCH